MSSSGSASASATIAQPDGAAREERREALKAVLAEARGCVRCPELAAARHTVVFGAGNADADLMFIGEAPGANEDQQGLPFVGQAGKLLSSLLEEIGLTREQVFIANVLKCRPPGNRDPLPVEIENCREYLFRQVELIQPRVICSLGNFSTKLLRGDPTGITRLHGRPEIISLGRRRVRLYPIFHPAAALYTRSMLETLRADFERLPGLLALPAPDQPEDWEPEAEPGLEGGALGAGAQAESGERSQAEPGGPRAAGPPDPADSTGADSTGAAAGTGDTEGAPGAAAADEQLGLF